MGSKYVLKIEVDVELYEESQCHGCPMLSEHQYGFTCTHLKKDVKSYEIRKTDSISVNIWRHKDCPLEMKED